jgi:hypothetical protein
MPQPIRHSDTREKFSAKAPVEPPETNGKSDLVDGAMPSSVPDVHAAPKRPKQLSARALNVLKELAVRLTEETPPRGTWTPTIALLEKLNFQCLATARNCGPQTIDEISAWAASNGVTMQPPFHSGKSLSAMWHELAVRFSNGGFSQSELAQALEKSIRRRNTRIPVAFQEALLRVLSVGDALTKMPSPEAPPAE